METMPTEGLPQITSSIKPHPFIKNEYKDIVLNATDNVFVNLKTRQLKKVADYE